MRRWACWGILGDTLATSSYLPIVECVDLLQIIIDSGSLCFTDNLHPSPLPYLLLLLAIKAQLFLIGNLSKTDVNSAAPPIYGYEPTASVGVRFKVFCQNYEHLRGESGGQCLYWVWPGGRSTLESHLPPSSSPPWSICHCLGKKETLERSFGAAEPACQFRWVNPRPREGVLPANLPPPPHQSRFQMSKYGASAQCQGGISGPCQ